MRRNALPPLKPHREGFEFEGRWITPEEAHCMCKDLMDRVDALPREKREHLHEHGTLDEWPTNTNR